MPYRITPIVPGEIYHVFNRSIASQPIFLSKRDYLRAIKTIEFYSYNKPRLRFSHYNRLPFEEKNNFLKELKNFPQKPLEILSFCLMSNHFHFLIKELSSQGITNFMRSFQDSYAKYFNIKNKRSGSVFQSMFKAIRIENDEQLLHVARYIHLNPYTNYVIKTTDELGDYSWSSYAHYLGKYSFNFISPEIIMTSFSSVERLKEFTLDQADYQRKLKEIKHLLLE